MVISSEIINSSFERLSDFISPGRHEGIRKIKDLSAAAVLVCTITAIITGLIVFIPEILKYLK